MAIDRLLRRLGLRRWRFGIMYRRGMTPWDTNVSPPELVRVVTGPGALPPGVALDIGCGTGTNAIFLAQHGWQVTALDFAAPAIQRAQVKYAAAQRTGISGSARFVRGDATRLEALGVQNTAMLLFDLGCLHGIPAAQRPAYAAGAARAAAPGALYLLYAFAPDPERGMGLSETDVRALFAPAFALEQVETGTDPGRGSAWYWLRRAGGA